MVLEVAVLYVKSGLEADFEQDFKKASCIISSISGYKNHQLQKCIEVENKYLLLVQWQKLEDHTIGFRMSEKYVQWKNLLHHYYDPFPIVEHYEVLLENNF